MTKTGARSEESLNCGMPYRGYVNATLEPYSEKSHPKY